MARTKFWVVSRAAAKRLAILALLLGVGVWWCSCTMIQMPGKSFRGPLPTLTPSQRSLAEELRRDVDMLAGVIGRRNVSYVNGLHAAVDFLEKSLTDAGYSVRRQSYAVAGVGCSNLEVEIQGTALPDEIIIIGAHYDSVDDSPAANDNASGAAATLALARRCKDAQPSRTVRFVLFVNEEPPFFQTADMGSLVYAKQCKQRGDNIIAMISVETIGYYSDAPGSQTYPIAPVGWVYPDEGNFIAFVGNYSSRKLVRQAIKSFRAHAQFPSEGGALPGWITGVGWSDHWAFWQAGYPAIMLTDTAPFRYPYYHSVQDTPDKLDYQRMARVVEGISKVIGDLANRSSGFDPAKHGT
jgi:hypothetical protein